MAYAFTFTPRFQKHFKNLTVQEKNNFHNSSAVFICFLHSDISLYPVLYLPM